MTAFNVVRFRTKAGREQDFIEAHRSLNVDSFTGSRRFVLVKTGPSAFCAVGEWESFDHIVNARPSMIGLLDKFRDMLEELEGGTGVTDPVSGEMVFEMAPPAKKTRRAPVARRKPASRARATAPRQGKPAKKKAAAKPAKRKKAAKKPARKPPAKKAIMRRR
jgi:NADH:ubiquinone oxidoreductase subunit